MTTKKISIEVSFVTAMTAFEAEDVGQLMIKFYDTNGQLAFTERLSVNNGALFSADLLGGDYTWQLSSIDPEGLLLDGVISINAESRYVLELTL